MIDDFIPYLAFQCARFGAVTGDQAQLLMSGISARNGTYRLLRKLRLEGWLEYRIIGHKLHCRPSPQLWQTLTQHYGFIHVKDLRAVDLVHSNAVFETLVTLAHFDRVDAVTTEYELSSKLMGDFVEGRTPDGIVRLSQHGSYRELAVEVETTLKSKTRIGQVIECYAREFARGRSRCTGVLIVTNLDRIYRAYLHAFEKAPESVRSRFQVVPIERLLELLVGTYGNRLSSPVKALENVRISYPGGATYESIKSRDLLNRDPAKSGICEEAVTRSEALAHFRHFMANPLTKESALS